MMIENFESFLSKSKTIYGDKFDYSLIDYNGYNQEVKIICPIHGVFTQKPIDHLRSKFGCQTCSMRNKNSGVSNTKQWILKAKEAHGEGRYDYRNSQYINKRTKINFFCPRHNIECEQYPGSHLQGYGCKLCGIEKSKATKALQSKPLAKQKISIKFTGLKKTTKDLLLQFTEVHSDKYDYQKVIYTGNTHKVEIGCQKCSENFFQTPSSHLSGNGCPWCAGVIKDTNMWVKKAKDIHGDVNDYSKTVYVNVKTKVKIRCIAHDCVFTISPQKHLLRAQGCKECGKEKLADTFRKSQEQFIAEAIAIYPYDHYDYSEVVYINSRTKVKVICQKHKPFMVTPNKHIGGKCGCPVCGVEKRTVSQMIGLDKFVIKGTNKYGDGFDYAHSIYAGKDRAITIVCKKHNLEFVTTPHLHLRTAGGCPKCISMASSAGVKLVIEALERHQIDFKIEVSAKKLFLSSPLLDTIIRTRFDIVVPFCKLIIEFDGEQHFFPVSFGGTSIEESTQIFNGVIKRDKMKDKLAKTSGWFVLRIPFWERDKVPVIINELFAFADKKLNIMLLKLYTYENNQAFYNLKIANGG